MGICGWGDLDVIQTAVLYLLTRNHEKSFSVVCAMLIACVKVFMINPII